MKLVFTWIQGCWKWTQARLLVEKYGFTLLEMWQELRKIISSWTSLWKELKEIMDAWFQVPWELWIKVMETAIENNLNSENIVYDAFVRNTWNKEIFDRLLPEYKVIFFELSIDKAKNRLLGRMYDEKTWETFPTWTIVNPISWDKLVKRNDDKDENAILKRIEEFENKTLPIVELQKNENRVITINADQNIESVFKELVTKLWL
mgnify:CR=1 FL=1